MPFSRPSRPAVSRNRFASVAPLGTAAFVAGVFIGPGLHAATQTLLTSGNWDTSTANWSGATTWVNGNDAVFGGTAAAVEIAGTITVSGISSSNTLVFNDAVPGGTITLVAGPGPATPFITGGRDITFNATLGGTAGLNINNTGAKVILNADNSLSGPLTVSAGTLELGVNGALNSVSSVSISSGAALTTGAINQLATVAVTNDGTLTLGGNDTVASLVNNGGTINGPGTLRAATYALNTGSTINADLGVGAINSAGSVTLNGSSAATTVNINSGTLATGASERLANTAIVTNASPGVAGTLALGGNETVGSLQGDVAVNLNANTLTLSSGAGTAAGTISGSGGLDLTAGTQTLSGANTYTGATNVNGGTLSLTGSLTGTTVNVGSGAALTSTGGLANATNLTLVGGGTLTLAGSETLASLSGGTGAITATGVDLTVTGPLNTAGALTVKDLTVGTLGGTTTITSSGTVTASAGSFGGVIADGALVKTGGGTLALTAAQASTDGTAVNAGTLSLGHATNTLADTGAVVVNTGATLDIGANTDTVGSLAVNGGTLAGSGTLTSAAGYVLNAGATVNSRLGNGAITANGAGVSLNNTTGAGALTVQSGGTTLTAAAGSTSVSVTGGTLTLTGTGSLLSAATVATSAGATLVTGGADQLSASAAVTNAGTFSVGGNQTVGTFVNTGTLSGSGVLTTANYQLGAGSLVSGNLGAGTVNVTGNTGVTGTAAAGTVNVSAGTLTLSGNNLSDTAAVTNSAGIALAGNDTVGTLVNTGTVSGAGTLTAATYNLGTGSLISGNLGAGTVNVTGNTGVTGTTAATSVSVASGVALTLDGDNLADSAAVTNDGTIALNGNDTIGSLVNNAATINGAGTLTAATYALNDGSVINANLGTGAITTQGAVALNGLSGIGGGSLTVSSGALTLNSTSGAGTVSVNDGSLLITADGEINNAATVGVSSGASLTTSGINQIGNATVTNAGTLTLGGNDIVSRLVSNGGVLAGTGRTLTATTGYALNGGSVIHANLGAGDVVAKGTVALNGTSGTALTSATDTLSVQSGTTTLAATSFATTVGVSNGAALTTASSSLLADTATVTNAGTLTLGGDDTIGALINSGALAGTGTLTAATYALNGGSVINANLGAGTVTSNGTVVLNGTAAAGTLRIDSGTLTTGSADRLADDAVVTNTVPLTAGTLALGGNETIGSLQGDAGVNLGANTLTLSAGAGTAAGVIAGTGGLTLTGGTQTLTGASTYTGATTVSGGTLVLNTTGSLASTDVQLSGTGSLSTQGGLANASVVTLTDTANLTLTDSQFLQGLVSAASGTTVTLGANALTIDSAGTDSTFAGQIGGTGTLTKLGAGTLTLTNSNTYTGVTLVGRGTLVLGHATDTLADTGSLVIGGGGVAILDLGANSEFVASVSSVGATIEGTGTLEANDYTLNNGTTINANLGTGIVTSVGAVALNGTAAAATVYIESGTLTTGAADRLADNAVVSNTVPLAAGTLALGGNETIGSLQGDAGVNLGVNTLTLSAGAGTAAGVLTGTGGLTLAAGTQTLTGANTYTGATTVSGGTLVLNTTGSLASTDVQLSGSGGLGTQGGLSDAAVVTLADTSNLTLTGNETLKGLVSAGGGTTVTLGANALTIASAGTDSIFAGQIGGTGTLTKSGTGTLTLTNANTFTGGTTVSGGTLALGNATNTLADTGALVIDTGATVDLGANTETVASLTNNGGTLAGTGTLTAATYALNGGSVINANLGAGTVTSNGTVAINGNTGTGTLAIASGTTTLAGASSAATVTVANSAALSTTGTGSLVDSAAVTLTGTGALNLGQSETIGSLSGAGVIALGANTLTLSTGTGGTSSALIGGTGGLTLAGGTQTLSADNTYTGATTLNGGTLTLSGTSQSGSLVVNAGTLNVNAASSATTADIAAGAFLTTGAANVILDNVIVTDNGTLTLGGNETLGGLTGSGTVVLGAKTLTFAGDGDGTPGEITGDFAGSISGSGQLFKSSADVQILSGSSSYSGIATVDAGVLRVTNSTALGTAGASARTVVNAGGTLQIGGGITVSEVIRPTGVGAAFTFTGNDSNLATLGSISNVGGNNTLTGQIGLIGGVPDIVIGANADKLTLTGDILRSGLATVPKLTFQTAENATIALTGSNAGFQLSNVVDIAKTGRGTLDITSVIGNNSSGDLYIQDGTVLVSTEARLGGSKVFFGSTDRGTLRIDTAATQVAIAAGAGNVLTGGDGTWADFRNTFFDFASGDGTFRTDADTAVALSRIQNTTGSFLVKTGAQDLLIDMVGVGSKILPGLLIDAGTVSFRTESASSLRIEGLSQSGGASGGSLALGDLNTTIAQSTSGTFSGGLSGTGDLVVNASDGATLDLGGVLGGFSSVSIGGVNGSVTLSGNSTYTGPTTVRIGGSLVLAGTSQTSALVVDASGVFTLGASDRLLDAATVTNNGTFDTGVFNDTVATFASTGGLFMGTGTLTAATYTLGAGTVVWGNLGLGALTVTGDTTITGTAAASTVAVDAGATLTLDGDNLADTAAVTNAGTVALGANTETVGGYTSNGGTLAGTGTLTAATYTMNGSSFVNANLGLGTLAVASGTTTLAGAASAGTVTVADTATLTTTSTGSLADTASLALAGTAIFNLGQNDTIGRLTGAGVVNLAANTLTLSNGGGATSSAVISGTGGLTLAGGTQILTAANAYTGATNVNGGTLDLNGTTASATLNVGPGAALNVNAAAAATTISVGANGVLTTGSANLLADNSVVTLSGTAANAARLVLGGNELIGMLNSSTNTAGRVDLGAYTLRVAAGGNFNGLVTGTGTLDLTGGTVTITDATVVNSRLDNNATLTLLQSVSANAQVSNAAGGVINLNGNTFTSAAGTTLAAGSVITGTNAGMFVQSGGTLSGTGTASNLRITSDGVLAPGNSPGVLNVTGNLEIGGGSGSPTYLAEWDGLSGAGAVSGHDQVKVAGTVTLSPASTLALTRSTGAFVPARGDRARILANAAGSGDPAITGVFSNVTSTFTNGVVVDLTTGELIGTGLNLASTGKGTRGIGADFTKYSGLTANGRTLLGAIQADAFAADPNGLQLRSSTASGMVVRDLLLDATDSPFVTTSKLSPETYAADAAYAVGATRNYAETALHTAPVIQAKDIGVFAAYTSLDAGRTDSSLDQADYGYKSGGFLLGGSTVIGNRLRIGAYGAFDNGSIDSDRRDGDVTGQSYGLFGEYVLNAKRTLALTAAGSLGNYDVDSTRGTALGTATATGVGTTATGLALGLRYDLVKTARYGFSPRVGLNYTKGSTGAFTETGPVDALAVQDVTYTSLQGELGARGFVKVSERFSFIGGLGLAQEMGDSETKVGARLAGGGTTVFSVTSPGYGATTLSADLGANYDLTPAFSVGAGAKLSTVADAGGSTSFFVGGGMKF